MADSQQIALLATVIPEHGLGDLRRGREQGLAGPTNERSRVLDERRCEQAACSDQKTTS
ncbi:hypothetical protein [Mesorhizobium sp. P5_C1]